MSAKAHKEISLFLSRVESKCTPYISSTDRIGLEHTRERLEWRRFPLYSKKQSKIWSSIAFGWNTFLPAHTDDDFFWSATSVITDQQFQLNDEVHNFFCFPNHGVAVALRPGDILIFNPQVTHCVSSQKTSRDVICLSLYLKTAIVGKNDNSLQLTPKDIEFASLIKK